MARPVPHTSDSSSQTLPGLTVPVSASLARKDQNDLVCGYQLQHKSWVFGPDGEAWEVFHTEGLAPDGTYGCSDMPHAGNE